MNLRPVFLLLLAEILVQADCSVSHAADIFNPQNGHFYRLVQFPELRWEDARIAAVSESAFGVAGYLATITSAEEQAFAEAHFLSALQPWGAWLGGYQPAGSPEPSGNWQWVTGESFSYTNWQSGEPSNGFGNENQLQLLSGGSWNDLGTSEPIGSPLYDLPYLVEFNVPEPTALLTLLSGMAIGSIFHRRRRRRPLSSENAA
jgi:Lectin C-type domain